MIAAVQWEVVIVLASHTANVKRFLLQPPRSSCVDCGSGTSTRRDSCNAEICSESSR